MNSSVPLWAFVALGMAAPTVALIGVMAESRRTHRNWLYQTKYESYERLLTRYFAMVSAYNSFLGSVVVTRELKEQLARAAQDFKNQFDKTALIASLRVGMLMETELLATWNDIIFQLAAAREGVRAPTPKRAWGGSSDTRDAVRYDLRVRRDPGGWLARWRDRGNVITDKALRREHSKNIRMAIGNPYEQPVDSAGKAPTEPD